MSTEHNPQAHQMGDESMTRNLAHQAQAIWPQEQGLFDRYGLSGPVRILDLGCGTGEITLRLADRYPQAQLIGVDILEGNLAIARHRSGAHSERIRYELGDAFALTYPDSYFDLIVCRHMSQAIPDFQRVLVEMTRVLKPGGWVHLLSEDYGMLHMPRSARDPDHFWTDTVVPYFDSIECDSRIGRNTPPLLDRLKYEHIAMDYVTVDTLRVARATFGQILRAWRDGYTECLAQASGRELNEVEADFNAMIAAVENPPTYVVWHVPIISGRKPRAR